MFLKTQILGSNEKMQKISQLIIIAVVKCKLRKVGNLSIILKQFNFYTSKKFHKKGKKKDKIK